MAEDDIYGSKARYEQLKERLLNGGLDKKTHASQVYICKNAENRKYFVRLFDCYESRDLSYIRRLRVTHLLRFVCWATDKDLKELDRDDIDKVLSLAHRTHKTLQSKKDLVRDLKAIWKIILPERDERGRIDDTLVPYSVRHLKLNFDKSKEKLRKDKLTWEEFQGILTFFGNDPQMQAYLSVAMESLGRPQEILYRKIGELETHDDYAKIWIGDHGKEGANGFLQIIDSFPYLMRWINQHPFHRDLPVSVWLASVSRCPVIF